MKYNPTPVWNSRQCVNLTHLTLLLALLLRATVPAASLETPKQEPFFAEKLLEMDTAIEQTISSNRIPGGVLWLERQGTSYHKAYGNRALIPKIEKMTEDTIFDAASLTKVIACAPAVMILVERGKINLDAPVVSYIPDFTGGGKENITIRHLLTHTSGLRSGIGSLPDGAGTAAAIKKACQEKLLSDPGATFRYSDINFFMLGEVVHRVSGQPLNEFATKEIYGPLKMVDTVFLPSSKTVPRIAPTEKIGSKVLRGVVHDPTSRSMGGVAGHAGLFTTAADLARYARMMLNLGALDGVRILREETVRMMTSVQTADSTGARRGLGWDIDSGYSRPRGKHFPLGSFGHTGFTGTSIWIDPFSQTFWIFLSNRVHPDRSGNVLPLQARLADLSAEAVKDFNFEFVPGSLAPRSAGKPGAMLPAGDVRNGIDVLAEENFARLKGRRIGLVTNHTGQDRSRTPTIDLLFNAPGVTLKALFSPEHGIRGALDEKVADSTDAKTGLPVYSLYGARRQPIPEQLAGLDTLVFDIQEIGCRFYTYISTMGNCLEAARKSHLKIFVLDRVNPINGIAVEGPVLNGKTNFTGFHQIPVRHGMTMGELAKMFNEERGIQADLEVVPLKNWSREAWFDQTGLPWTNPSPNMRSLAEAALYPGIGLLETTALSVGRGTDTPFEIIGAPYIDDLKFCAELNRAGLKGVRFVPIRFTPSASVYKGTNCQGVNIIITDRDACEVVDIGVTAASILHQMHPKEFLLPKFNTLLVEPGTIAAVKENQPLAKIKAAWAGNLTEFKTRREKFLLYR